MEGNNTPRSLSGYPLILRTRAFLGRKPGLNVQVLIGDMLLGSGARPHQGNLGLDSQTHAYGQDGGTPKFGVLLDCKTTLEQKDGRLSSAEEGLVRMAYTTVQGTKHPF